MPALVKRFVDLGSDVNWEKFGGLWGKKMKTGGWLILRFENEKECSNGNKGFLAEILHVDFSSSKVAERNHQALSCCGYKQTPEGIDDGNGCIFPKSMEQQVLVQAYIAYGFYTVLDTFKSKVRPKDLRNKAFRCLLGQL